VSLFTSKYLDLDIVRRVIGLDTPFTKREAEDVLFFTSLFLNVGVSSLWFFATTLFARRNSPALNAREDAFFERMNQPVVSDPAKTRAMDHAQLRTLGILGIPYGGFVVLLALVPNPLSGRLCFVFAGGAILAVAGILLAAARRMERRTVASAAASLSLET
jgi:solute:Na+ symporter, SSS family